MEVFVGVALVLLGAASATAVSRTASETGRRRWLPLLLVPPGILIGAGAATARGWDLFATTLAGAVLVPVVGVLVRLRIRRRERPHP